MKRESLAGTLVLALATMRAQAALPAFPTAEGYGKWATGGRGGRVVEVTTLQDSVKGSFRWAMQQYTNEPVTIVFRVSGIIQLKGILKSKRTAGTTIAGQTAPGEGIVIRGGSVNMGGSTNVIVRNVRFRIGSEDGGTFIAGGSFNLENGGNFILDHCVFGWSAEEAVTVYDDKDLTVQWSMFHEGLYAAGHPKGSRGYGPVLGGRTASYHHNLIAHNVTRSPRFGTSTENDVNVLIDFVNNVVYNWGKSTFSYGGENELGPSGSVKINMVNNYYKPGPAYPGDKYSRLVCPSYEPGAEGTSYTMWHLSGNSIEGSANTAINTDNLKGVDISEITDAMPGATLGQMTSPSKFPVGESVKTDAAKDAFAKVLASVGTVNRDAHERRIIAETTEGTASGKGVYNGKANVGIIDHQSGVGGYGSYRAATAPADADHDGMPDAWEKAHGLNPNDESDRNKTNLSLEGYTNLEMYLNESMGDPVKYATSATSTGGWRKVDLHARFADGKLLVAGLPGTDAIVRVRSVSGAAVAESESSRTEFVLGMEGFPEGVYVVEVFQGSERLDATTAVKSGRPRGM